MPLLSAPCLPAAARRLVAEHEVDDDDDDKAVLCAGGPIRVVAGGEAKRRRASTSRMVCAPEHGPVRSGDGIGMGRALRRGRGRMREAVAADVRVVARRSGGGRGRRMLRIDEEGEASSDEREHGDRKTELVCIGQELDHATATAALDKCLLTEEEMRGGMATWSSLPDPFHEEQCSEED